MQRNLNVKFFFYPYEHFESFSIIFQFAFKCKKKISFNIFNSLSPLDREQQNIVLQIPPVEELQNHSCCMKIKKDFFVFVVYSKYLLHCCTESVHQMTVKQELRPILHISVCLHVLSTSYVKKVPQMMSLESAPVGGEDYKFYKI